ncbi:MAG: hypothetical protein GYA14_01010 [Ignavibacteria bacterium]|nr:hypothetical protein [Ignavibacteria bacterium]
MEQSLKITIEGIPGIGKTTLYKELLKTNKNIIIGKSDDFVKASHNSSLISDKISKLLISQDNKFLKLGSPLGETFLLLAKIAFKQDETNNKRKKGVYFSDKSIDTFFSHQMVQLSKETCFKTNDEIFQWLLNILKPFYKFPDITFYLRPTNIQSFIKSQEHLTKKEKIFLLDIYHMYDYIYTKEFFKKRTYTIDINPDTTQEDIYNFVQNKIYEIVYKHK